MSGARLPEAGSARGFLVLGIAAVGTAGAWLAWGGVPRQSGSAREVRGAEAAAPRAPSPRGDASAVSSSDRTSATPAKDAVAPAAAPAEASDRGWVACLDLQDSEAMRECLAARMDATPDAVEIARALCNGTASHAANRMVLGEALLRIPPTHALAWIGPAETQCPRLLGWGDLENALEWCESRDSAWFQAFRQTLTPDVLFAPESGEAGILFSVWFLKKGDAEMRTWIEKGAHGEWGGTSAQIDRAIGASLTIPRTSEERLAFLRSVLDSTRVPGEAGVGSTFANQLLDKRSWPDGRSPAALDTLMQVLYEPRFQESAAATVVLHFPVDAPAGCDADTWTAIRARSMEIARAIGLATK